jgi:transcriptional regulator with GAF, ATPase, and Fis domain
MYDLQQDNRRLKVQQGSALSGVITRDAGMLKVCRLIEKVASANVTVMLLGESGTGKEVLARGLHELSPRRNERFVAINCAAIPENLLESELFGYERAPSPARSSRPSARSRWPTRAPSSSTKSAICRCPCRPSCCASCRSG